MGSKELAEWAALLRIEASEREEDNRRRAIENRVATRMRR